MAVKLHTCGVTWLKIDGHACWRVEKALRDRGIDYEVVKEPTFPRGRRTAIKEHTGQEMLPVVETADGNWIREDSKALVARIEAGEFD
ncbi:MAG: glutathione S-transferase N-terminal domain-containing protein [Solirubrobacterales bacterium]